MSIESAHSSGESPISVILAHPHALIREGIASILNQAGFGVVGQADSMADLKRLMTTQKPDVVLLDWGLPDSGAEAVESLVSLLEQEAGGVVAVLTGPQPPETFSTVIKTGIGGYLSVNLPPEEFIGAMRILAKGDMVVSREAAADLKNELASTDTSDAKGDLSGREREVLNLVSRGATNREIGNSLTITENTVKVHLRRILDKLDLRNRQQAAAYAVQEGLVDDVLEGIEPPSSTE